MPHTHARIRDNGLRVLGGSLTLIRFEALAASAFRNATAQLRVGLWVVLAHRDDAAAEFTRVLAGVQRPSAGRVWFDSDAPYSNPAIRRSIAAALPRENYEFASTVRQAIESITLYRGLPLKPEAVLELLDLQHLANRKTTHLTTLEARQVSIALVMAQVEPRFVVIYEPLLTLRDSQIRKFQDWLSQASQCACVVCVSSSSHDAQLLGGAQAHLTRRGWEPATLGAVQPASRSVFLEGRNVRALASALALESGINGLQLNTSARSEALHVTCLTRDVSTNQIIAKARDTGAYVSRLWTEILPPTSLYEPTEEATAEPEAAVRAVVPAGRSTFRALIDEARLSVRPLLTPLGLVSLTLEPGLAWTYGTLKRAGNQGWGAYDTLVFTGTILAPVWSIGITKLLLPSRTSGDELQIVSRFGTSRKISAMGRVLLGTTIAGLLSALAAIFGMLGASSWRALAPAVSELYQSSWIIGLAGAVYGSIAMFLSTFKRRWLLCWAFILLDFALGGGSRGVSFPFPRAHIHNLLGSPSSIQFLQQGSCVYLALLGTLAIGLVMAKTEA